ncbi:OmpA family protein [Aestuariivirga sp.]|uniref:OmpA family protein n=1 Tax=Aestuariivirga sp. TaxID=2650926 RepID=UPI0039E3C9A0
MTLAINRFRAFAYPAMLICAGPWLMSAAAAQEGLGPFMPHDGGMLTTAWTNTYGPDAESWVKFAKVGADSYDIYYSSSRGMRAIRRMMTNDAKTAHTLVLGYNAKMPLALPGTTAIGVSTAVIDDLRSAGQSRLDLIPDTSLQPMTGTIRLAGKTTMPISLDGTTDTIPVVHVVGTFARGKKKADGDLYFLDNRNNPVLLEYSLRFTGEKTPRTEQIVLVTSGADQRSAMQQALAAKRAYTTRGIHFDFDKATIQPESSDLIREIAVTLKNNPLWTLQITGHTDNIGKAKYNQGLSEKRANAIKAALVAMGVQSSRLTTLGAGPSQPVATNATLEGRSQNRRVVLMRTDR